MGLNLDTQDLFKGNVEFKIEHCQINTGGNNTYNDYSKTGDMEQMKAEDITSEKLSEIAAAIKVNYNYHWAHAFFAFQELGIMKYCSVRSFSQYINEQLPQLSVETVRKSGDYQREHPNERKQIDMIKGILTAKSE